MKRNINLAILSTLIWFALLFSHAQLSSKSKEHTTLAVEFIELLVKEDYNNAINFFDSRMKGALPESKLRMTWQSLIQQVGHFKRIAGAREERITEYTIIYVTCEFEKSTLDAKVVFNQAKQIAGLFFIPGQPPSLPVTPSEKPVSLNEKEVKIGTGEWALPGTLTLPPGKGPFPAVVLVHASGPHDRDETIGPNKPFRDIAWGLTTRGIAVLRYDKRTFVHGKMMQPKDITVEEEVIEDAIKALEFLENREEIIKKGIFLLGHSLGATLAPEIATRFGNCAGIIMLAAVARPLERAAYEQLIYLSTLTPQTSQSEAEQLNAILKQLESIETENLPENEIVLGMSGRYFYDLHKRNAIDFTKKLSVPILILHGRRDYQSTMQDFQIWQRELGKNLNVTLKSYPELNHLFIKGKGKSTPAEYQTPGHVSSAVIQDIAEWIQKQL